MIFFSIYLYLEIGDPFLYHNTVLLFQLSDIIISRPILSNFPAWAYKWGVGCRGLLRVRKFFPLPWEKPPLSLRVSLVLHQLFFGCRMRSVTVAEWERARTWLHSNPADHTPFLPIPSTAHLRCCSPHTGRQSLFQQSVHLATSNCRQPHWRDM